MITRLGSAAAVAALAVMLAPQDAEACGCFAPPDPTVPIVQAGERILFSVANGVVTAHIQIRVRLLWIDAHEVPRSLNDSQM